eukprot:TRINITY_DN4108_c1_g1_i6.p1 TRINITY_DN4108_c1_g1~~TRINITY_DN4108_c1_g1_i6.p1  ORF type:complete len:832 (+),score=172.61 TRINITY_DN4108_c1_g1_i6:95-2590(+)
MGTAAAVPDAGRREEDGRKYSIGDDDASTISEFSPSNVVVAVPGLGRYSSGVLACGSAVVGAIVAVVAGAEAEGAPGRQRSVVITPTAEARTTSSERNPLPSPRTTSRPKKNLQLGKPEALDAGRTPKSRRRRANLRRYQRGRQLGQGGFGTVYQGIDTLTGQFVAIKEVKAEAVREELQTLQMLSHTNIVRYIDYEEAGNGMMLIYLEYVEGGSLASVLGQFGSLGELIVRSYTAQVVDGLQYLHDKSVAHRDIKPGNLLVAADGTVKLADFGTASTLAGAGVDDQSLVGTPQYLSPEALRGHQSLAADVWALGCTVVELSSGQPPWHKLLEYETMYDFMHKVAKSDLTPQPPDILSQHAKAFVGCCLKRDRSERATCADLKKHVWLTSEIAEDEAFPVKELSGVISPRALSRSPRGSLTSPRVAPRFKAASDEGDLHGLDASDITGLFVAVFLCNDSIAETFYDTISGPQAPERPSSPEPEDQFLGVEGTPDGLVTVRLGDLHQINGFEQSFSHCSSFMALTPASPMLPPGDITFKFDVFFDKTTSPRDLYAGIGEPILSTLKAGAVAAQGGKPKTVALWCTSMVFAGETTMAVGKSTEELNVFGGEGQGLLPLLVHELFRRSEGFEVWISSMCAKRGKAKVYDNLGHRIVSGRRTKRWSTLGPVVRQRAPDSAAALRMLGLAEIAFTGCLSPHMFVFELRHRGPQGDATAAQLFVSLYYGRQWTYWLNGLTQLIYRHFAYRAGNEDNPAHSPTMHPTPSHANIEDTYGSNPLLSIAEEIFEDESSMNYVLHNFHQQAAAAPEIHAALNALRNASVGRTAPVRMKEGKD